MWEAKKLRGWGTHSAAAAPPAALPPQGKGTRAVVAMAKKSVGDLKQADLDGKTVFVRADLNVPLDKVRGGAGRGRAGGAGCRWGRCQGPRPLLGHLEAGQNVEQLRRWPMEGPGRGGAGDRGGRLAPVAACAAARPQPLARPADFPKHRPRCSRWPPR